MLKKLVEIISMRDADQPENTDIIKVYGSENKKIFHDIDCMDRYNTERLQENRKIAEIKLNALLITK